MSQIKSPSILRTTHITKPLDIKINTKKLSSIRSNHSHFRVSPVYLNKTLVYVDFISTNDLNPQQDTNDAHKTLVPKLLLLLLLGVYILYYQYLADITSEREIGALVTTNLIQFGNDPVLSASVIKVLSYTLV